MSSPTGSRKRAKRRALLSWVPTVLIAVICAAVVVGAIAVQNSWWAETAPRASTDQRASDGMSLFDSNGVDFFTREGVVRVRIGDEALPATDLGLEADGAKTIEPLVPVLLVVLTGEGAITLELVRAFTVTSADDEIVSIDVSPESNGTWTSASSQLAGLAPTWGWTPEQLQQLESDLAASQLAGDEPYSAELPAVPHKGAMVSAEVEVDTVNPGVALVLTIAAPPRTD